MSHNVTTSIRLTPGLRKQLEKASQTLHRGKNWIIAKALEEYLARLNYTLLAEEAKRQSLLASQMESNEANAWEQQTDMTGWQ